MCRTLLAHHQPCKHTHHSFARCLWARLFDEECCQLPSFPIWEYTEHFRCPSCRAFERMEVECLLEKGREGTRLQGRKGRIGGR